MSQIKNFEWYATHVLKIQTKTQGLRPFKLMPFQLKYIHHINNDFHDGIVRSIVLKARQSGFSTLLGGYFTHKMVTNFDFKMIMLADKAGRTDEVFSIYRRFVNNIPDRLKPMLARDNEREILFDHPNPAKRRSNPGLRSSIQGETANDAQAGRSGTRKAAHLTEAAFFPYADKIDESVGNSIPLYDGTYIIKESTANGMAGHGEYFYNLWMAAERGETIYKPFFVAWYLVTDYKIPVPHGFILTKQETDLIRRCPEITNENLAWRRMKIREYSGTDSILTPEERFCEDFPSYPEEAFLSTGRPVFDQDKLKDKITELRNHPPGKVNVIITKPTLQMFRDSLTVFKAPEPGKRYIIGADIAEGLESGDYSHAFVMSEDRKQCAFFHGHIDSDLFGKVLVELAKIYNDALLVPEINNMGLATLAAIKNERYTKIYVRSTADQLIDEKNDKLGWRTTSANKMQMLSRLIAWFRDDELQILDIDLLREMQSITREPGGDVVLNSKDRVAACCLCLMGIDQLHQKAIITNPEGKKQKIQFETKDLFRDKVLIKERGK